jgi:hypothetical protein
VITVAPTATAPSHRRYSPTPVAPRAAEAVSLSLTGLSKPLRTHHESTTVRLVDRRLREPPAPTRPPSPVLTPTLEQGEASEVDGDEGMAEPEDDIKTFTLVAHLLLVSAGFCLPSMLRRTTILRVTSS